MKYRKRELLKRFLRAVIILLAVIGLICLFSHITAKETEGEMLNEETKLEIKETPIPETATSSAVVSLNATAGISRELSIMLINAEEEAEQQRQEELKLEEEKRKAEEARKKKLEAKKKKKEEERRKYKENHPHYEVYDPSDKSWHHLDTDLQDYLKDLCDENKITEHFPLLLVQLYCESGYKSNLVSATNDYGIAQINSCNHSDLRKELGITDFLDPYQSIKCNVYYMAQFLSEYPPNQALSKYNTGQAYNSTAYSRRVLGRYNGGAGVRKMDN